jgi:hypothetical protein
VAVVNNNAAVAHRDSLPGLRSILIKRCFDVALLVAFEADRGVGRFAAALGAEVVGTCDRGRSEPPTGLSNDGRCGRLACSSVRRTFDGGVCPTAAGSPVGPAATRRFAGVCRLPVGGRLWPWPGTQVASLRSSLPTSSSLSGGGSLHRGPLDSSAAWAYRAAASSESSTSSLAAMPIAGALRDILRLARSGTSFIFNWEV